MPSCTHARMHACTHANMHAHAHAHKHARMHARKHACTHAHTHKQACASACKQHGRTHTHTHAHNGLLAVTHIKQSRSHRRLKEGLEKEETHEWGVPKSKDQDDVPKSKEVSPGCVQEHFQKQRKPRSNTCMIADFVTQQESIRPIAQNEHDGLRKKNLKVSLLEP